MKNGLQLGSQSPSPIDATNLGEELDLQKYWLVLQRRWWLIALATLTGLTIAGLYVLSQPKNYQATGKLLVKPDESSQLTGFDGNSGELKALTDKGDPLSTEAEILKSHPVLAAAANVLNLEDPQGKAIDAKQLAKHLKVKTIAGTDILQVTYNSESPEVAAQVVNQVIKSYINHNVQDNQSQAEKARNFIEKELKRKEVVVRKAEDGLKRFREGNGVVSLERETEESVRNIGALNQNIDSSTALVYQAEARVAQLRSQVGMDVTQALKVNALNQSKTIQKALEDLRLAQSELSQQRTVFQEGTSEIAALVDKVKAAETTLNNQTREITGQQLAVTPGQLQVSQTQQDLATDLAKAEVDLTSLRQGLGSLMQSRSELVARSRSMPALEATQRELQRQVDAAQITYKTLLTKLQEVQVAKNQNIGNARLVSEAIPPDQPALLPSMFILLGSGVTGLLLGISLAYLIDYADRTLKTLKEVKELLSYPVLGMIPQVQLSRGEAQADALPRLLTKDFPHFGAQESYQMLQANLRFLPTDQSARSIVVTSAMRQEGKSTVAANLAVALAQGQRRVLLIDADLRQGSQHHVWGLSNRVGLSNVVVGQVQMDEAIATIRPNLHVITAGAIPPNPLALLDSATMSGLIQYLLSKYDFVIFDAPPLLGTADSTVLNRMVDGSLLVMRLGMVDAERIKAMDQVIAQASLKVLGVVMNGVDTSNDRDGQFYSGLQTISKKMEKTKVR